MPNPSNVKEAAVATTQAIEPDRPSNMATRKAARLARIAAGWTPPARRRFALRAGDDAEQLADGQLTATSRRW